MGLVGGAHNGTFGGCAGVPLAIGGESAHMQPVDTRTDDFAAPFDSRRRLPTSLPK